MFRTIRIRTKLALALSVPLLAFASMATFEVLDAGSAAAEVREQTSLAAGAVGPGSLVTRLQDERNRAAIDLLGLGAATDLPVDTNEEARELVDEAVEGFGRQVDAHGDVVREGFTEAFAGLEDLEDLRGDVDAYDGPLDISNTDFADEVFSRYTTVVEAFFDATSTAALGVDDAMLRTGVNLVDAATRQAEMRARLVREIILLNLTGDADSVEGRQRVAALHDRSEGFDAQIVANSVGPYAGVADATFAEERVQAFKEQVEEFLDGGAVDITRLLDSVRSSTETGYTGLRYRAADELLTVASDLRGAAHERRNAFLAAALFATAAALAVTWTASRSITRPLRSLTLQASEMAGSTLPAAVQEILDTPPGDDVVIPEIEAVEVRSRDEVRDVAGALNAVQRSAVDLAVEQAVLRRNIADSFVNLGRRNQNLLNRQIDAITDLERSEADPDVLEGLFRLDHLATRMRRNAESLLVLAGVDPPRQWTAPVATADVVRAALGEVEDYQRVVVRNLEPATVVGSAAADVAHVLAELIENALMFSPAEDPVEVRGRLTPDGYTIAVVDSGMGMSSEDMARANRRLSGAESFTVAPSRYLGHYVAGHLAERIGLRVELQQGPTGGTTARVDLPMSLLPDGHVTPSEADALDAPPAPVVTAVPPAVPGPSPVAALPPVSAPLPPPPAAEGLTVAGLPRRPRGRHFSPARVVDISGPDAPAPSGPVPTTTPEPTTPETVAPPVAPAPSETVVPPAPVAPPVAPAPTGQTLGGTLPHPPVAPPAAVPATPTSSGLPRRVPGTQRPDVPIQRFGTTDAAAADARTAVAPTVDVSTAPPEPPAPLVAPAPAPAPPASTPGSNADDVYAFLSSFRSGVERGLAAARDTDEEGSTR